MTQDIGPSHSQGRNIAAQSLVSILNGHGEDDADCGAWGSVKDPGNILRHLTATEDAVVDGWSVVYAFASGPTRTLRLAGTCYRGERCWNGTGGTRGYSLACWEDRALLVENDKSLPICQGGEYKPYGMAFGMKRSRGSSEETDRIC